MVTNISYNFRYRTSKFTVTTLLRNRAFDHSYRTARLLHKISGNKSPQTGVQGHAFDSEVQKSALDPIKGSLVCY
jgi:hypothetical protein